MPRPSKGARLYLRKRAEREPTWVILDLGEEIATGCSEADREQAEKALADYLVRKYESPSGPCGPDQMSISRALEIYGNERAAKVVAPRIIGFAIDALLPFWGHLPVSTIKEATCTLYERQRNRSAATVKRELIVLGTAVNYCVKQGYLTSAPSVTTPTTPEGRTRWLTRSEAAALLRAARRVPHLATFIMIGLYTGTRPGAILALQWLPNIKGGWVDLEHGVLHRGAEGRVKTKKGQPPCPLPAKLLTHLRRARRRTRQYVCEFDGQSVARITRSWRGAVRRAGLGKDVVPHTLRHTSVTWRLLKGGKIWDVAHYVGMSEEMVRRRYGHHSPDFLKEQRDAI
jgi:integrase